MLERVNAGHIVLDMLRMFVDDAPERLENLRQALRHHDADAVQRAAHKLKGSAANIRAGACVELLQVMEDHGEAGRVEEAAQMLPRVEAALDELVVYVRERLDAWGS